MLNSFEIKEKHNSEFSFEFINSHCRGWNCSSDIKIILFSWKKSKEENAYYETLKETMTIQTAILDIEIIYTYFGRPLIEPSRDRFSNMSSL